MPADARSTIFALSSGAPPAAIAIVRISGPAAGAALDTLAGTRPPPRHAAVRSLRDAAGDLLDRALVLWLPGPHTATGEDLAELHLHGGRAVIAAVLDALATLPGLCAAEPGAFTRRAFINGRIDLAAAEGLADLLTAETDSQRRQALRLAEGGLGRLIEGWRTDLISIAAMVEARIDHDDESDVTNAGDDVPAAIAALQQGIADALRRPPAERMRDGVRILLAGPPNAGKSSLFNNIAGRDAAIVADVPGTTRDLVEAPIILDGLPCILVDSAGLRISDDAVENIGVDRTLGAIDTADLILWLGPISERPSSDAIAIRSRCDLSCGDEGADIAVSVVTGEGVAELRVMIAERVRALLPPEAAISLHARHRRLLGNVVNDLQGGMRETDPILIAERLRSARHALDRVTGRAGVEDMLDALFARFCVGK